MGDRDALRAAEEKAGINTRESKSSSSTDSEGSSSMGSAMKTGAEMLGGISGASGTTTGAGFAMNKWQKRLKMLTTPSSIPKRLWNKLVFKLMMRLMWR